MILTVFTLFHVALSVAGLIAGSVAILGLLRSTMLPRWTAAFLSTTVATSVTGFLFPSEHFMPAHAIGIISLIGLGVAIFALYFRRLRGGWRTTYVVSAVISLYLNMFVAVVQAFQKIPILEAAAPTQSEPPFVIAQAALMALFIVFGWRAWKGFRVAATGSTRSRSALAS